MSGGPDGAAAPPPPLPPRRAVRRACPPRCPPAGAGADAPRLLPRRVAALTAERLQAGAAEQLPLQVMRLMFSAAQTCDAILREKASTPRRTHLLRCLAPAAPWPPCRLAWPGLQPAPARPRAPAAAPTRCAAPMLVPARRAAQGKQEHKLKDVLGRTIAEMEAQLGAQQQQVQALQEQLAQQAAAAAVATQVRLAWSRRRGALALSVAGRRRLPLAAAAAAPAPAGLKAPAPLSPRPPRRPPCHSSSSS